MTRTFCLGVDIGQRQDHSAVCLVERLPSKVVVRLLIKYPLGTPYDLLVRTVAELVGSVQREGDIEGFTVDATGVGAAPSQMFQEVLPDLRVDAFIFSNKTKRELVGHVKVLHAFGRLRFATRKGDEVYNRTLTELLTEMKQLQVKVLRESEQHPEVEVFKTGAHDDLFTALALAVKDIRFDNVGRDVAFVEDTTWVQIPELASSDSESVLLF